MQTILETLNTQRTQKPTLYRLALALNRPLFPFPLTRFVTNVQITQGIVSSVYLFVVAQRLDRPARRMKYKPKLLGPHLFIRVSLGQMYSQHTQHKERKSARLLTTSIHPSSHTGMVTEHIQNDMLYSMLFAICYTHIRTHIMFTQ